MNHCTLPSHIPEDTGLCFRIWHQMFFLKGGLWFALDLNPNQETTSFWPPFLYRHKPPCEVLPGYRGKKSLEQAQGCSDGQWPHHCTRKHFASVSSQSKPKGLYFCQEIQQFLGISKRAFKTATGTWGACFCFAFSEVYLQSSNCCQHITKSVKWPGDQQAPQ